MNIFDYKDLAYKSFETVTGYPITSTFEYVYDIILIELIVELYKKFNNREDFEKELLAIVNDNSEYYSLVDKVKQFLESSEYNIKYNKVIEYKGIFHLMLVNSFNNIRELYEMNKVAYELKLNRFEEIEYIKNKIYPKLKEMYNLNIREIIYDYDNETIFIYILNNNQFSIKKQRSISKLNIECAKIFFNEESETPRIYIQFVNNKDINELEINPLSKLIDG